MSETAARNIVLVHGGFVDGSGWEGVYHATVVEVGGSHAIYVSQPAAVAKLIVEAAEGSRAVAHMA